MGTAKDEADFVVLVVLVYFSVSCGNNVTCRAGDGGVLLLMNPNHFSYLDFLWGQIKYCCTQRKLR